MSRLGIALALFFLLGESQIFSQTMASPIMPEYIRKERIGLAISPLVVTQQGSYNTSCNCPEFRDGTGGGLMLGLTYEPATTSRFVLGIMGGFETRSITSRYMLIEDTEFKSATIPSIRFSPIALRIRHESNANIKNLFAMPYLKVFPFASTLYFSLGTQVSYIAAAKYDHIIRAEDNVVRLPDGTTNLVGLDEQQVRAKNWELLSSTSARIESSDFTSVNHFQFGLMAGFGAEIRLSRHVFLVPSLNYNMQFIPISANTIGFRMSSLNAIVEVQYIL